MSVQALRPSSTTKAKRTALASFKCFLAQQTPPMSLAFVDQQVAADPSSKALQLVMDQFGASLVLRTKALSRNTVLAYFRHVKLRFYDIFPTLQSVAEAKLLRMARTLGRFCIKRPSGGITKKAPACTKADLAALMTHLYTTATGGLQYQDACLLCLLWYLFGRASDVTVLQKPNIAIGGNGILFLRLVRIKTSEEQGLSLFPDASPTTCPFVAMACAFVMQPLPVSLVLSNLPAAEDASCILNGVTASLRDMLLSSSLNDIRMANAGDDDGSSDEDEDEKPSQPKQGVHAYVNALLRRLNGITAAKQGLTSHSFRRGGAQHANGDAELAPQWICDRGAWNMTGTSKAFAYIFNTAQEDQRVAKVLSGFASNATVKLLDLTLFDSQTRLRIAKLQAVWFQSAMLQDDVSANVCPAVLDVLTAYLIRAYVDLVHLNVTSPLIKRLSRGAYEVGIDDEVIASWSVFLKSKSCTAPVDTGSDGPKDSSDNSNLIHLLLAQNERLVARLDAYMSLQRPPVADEAQEQHHGNDVVAVMTAKNSTPPRNRKSEPTSLKATWYQWYASVPPMWNVSDEATRHKKSDAKNIVAFMRIFLDDYSLDTAAFDYQAQVLALGEIASKRTLDFVHNMQAAAKAPTTCLKVLRKAHAMGSLHNQIAAFEQRYAAGKVIDPTPRKLVLGFKK